MTNQESCGCRVEYDAPPDGVRLTVPRIAYCPLHKAAPELLQALQLIEAGGDRELHWQIARAAITSATQGEAWDYDQQGDEPEWTDD